MEERFFTHNRGFYKTFFGMMLVLTLQNLVAYSVNKASARNKLLRDLQVMLAGAMCKGITRDEVHEMIDMIYDYYEQPANYPEEG